jgi:DNA-directed RNA polymerase subunit RPC12/RpoP
MQKCPICFGNLYDDSNNECRYCGYRLSKWKNKIEEIVITKEEMWKELKYEWNILHFKENAKIWDKCVIKWKWYNSDSSWERWDLIYVIAEIL